MTKKAAAARSAVMFMKKMPKPAAIEEEAAMFTRLYSRKIR